MKTLKGIGAENLSNPKFIAPKVIMDHKRNEFKLN